MSNYGLLTSTKVWEDSWYIFTLPYYNLDSWIIPKRNITYSGLKIIITDAVPKKKARRKVNNDKRSYTW